MLRFEGNFKNCWKLKHSDTKYRRGSEKAQEQVGTDNACNSSTLWVRLLSGVVRHTNSRVDLPNACQTSFAPEPSGSVQGERRQGWLRMSFFYHPIQSLRLLVSVSYSAQRKSGMRAQDRNGLPPSILSGSERSGSSSSVEPWSWSLSKPVCPFRCRYSPQCCY